MEKDSSLWSCVYPKGVKYGDLNVWHRPSDEYPICISDNQWPYYLVNDSLNLNCSTSKGNPEVELFVNVTSENLKLPHVDIVHSDSSFKSRKEILLKAVLDETSNEAYFICSVFQGYPRDGDSRFPPFYRSCRWGPIIIFKKLSVSLRSLNESVYMGSTFSFVCICNVPDALITWNVSPSLPNRSYLFEPKRSIITVYIPEDASSSYLMISCEATYRRKRVAASEIFSVSQNRNNLLSFVCTILIVVGTVLVVFVVIATILILVMRIKGSVKKNNCDCAPTDIVATNNHGNVLDQRLSRTTSRRYGHAPTSLKALNTTVTSRISMERRNTFLGYHYDRQVVAANSACADEINSDEGDYHYLTTYPDESSVSKAAPTSTLQEQPSSEVSSVVYMDVP